MVRRDFVAALGALAFVGCASTQPKRSHARGPQLWLARRGKARVFVLGSSDAKDDSWLTPQIDQAFRDSTDLWLETPPPPPLGESGAAQNRQIAELVQKLGYQPGRTFYQALEPSVRTRAEAYVADLHIEASIIEPMRPWLAYYTINAAFWQKYQRAYEVQNVDTVLRERATREAKAVYYESPTTEALFRKFAEMPDAAQSQFIEMLLDFLDDEKNGRSQDTYDWVKGRPSTRSIDRMRISTPTLYKAIQVDRNVWWAKQIDSLLSRGGTHFLLVGMNHTLGPDGIPRQLERLKVATPVDLGAS